MTWKTIGRSVIGSSHLLSGKDCEDAVAYETLTLTASEHEALICFVSDGAGSATFAKEAATTSVQLAVSLAAAIVVEKPSLTDQDMLQIAEGVYDGLEAIARERSVPKNEFSCTLLGCILLPQQAAFLQIGDGAMVRSDDSGYLSPVFWPHNGEYQNSTAFVIDNPNLPDLRIKIVDEAINEIGMFSDGLQMLTLNHETKTVHQPFFTGLFKWLSMATEAAHIASLNLKLEAYLSGEMINNRTDDDKTLFLATRLS